MQGTGAFFKECIYSHKHIINIDTFKAFTIKLVNVSASPGRELDVIYDALCTDFCRAKINISYGECASFLNSKTGFCHQ